MSNSASCFVRMDPALKENAESVLEKLGITPSSAVQMLYSQIVLTQSLPLELKLPSNKPVCIADLTLDEFKAEIAKGLASIERGERIPAKDIKEEFGL